MNFSVSTLSHHRFPFSILLIIRNYKSNKSLLLACIFEYFVLHITLRVSYSKVQSLNKFMVLGSELYRESPAASTTTKRSDFQCVTTCS